MKKSELREYIKEQIINSLSEENSGKYAEGQMAATKGKKYDENPYKKGTKDHLEWSKGHNQARARKSSMGENLDKDKTLTYDNFVQMVRDDMMAGAAPDERPSDEQVRKRAKIYFNDYLRGTKVFEGQDAFFYYDINELQGYIRELEKQKADAISKGQSNLVDVINKDIEAAQRVLKNRAQKMKNSTRTDIDELETSYPIVDKLVKYFKGEINRGNLQPFEIDDDEIIAGANRIGIRMVSQDIIDDVKYELEDNGGEDSNLSAIDRMYNSDDWVQAQRDMYENKKEDADDEDADDEALEKKAPAGDKEEEKKASKRDKIIKAYRKAFPDGVKPYTDKATKGDKEALAYLKKYTPIIKAYNQEKKVK